MTVDLQEVSRTLFATADQLWANTALRPDQYAQPVLALIALRQMEAKFEKVHSALAPQFRGRLKPSPEDYRARGAVYLPNNARFSRLLGLPETADLGSELNESMKAIAETNPDLATALPRGYGGLPNATLRELLRLLAPLKLRCRPTGHVPAGLLRTWKRRCNKGPSRSATSAPPTALENAACALVAFGTIAAVLLFDSGLVRAESTTPVEFGASN